MSSSETPLEPPFAGDTGGRLPVAPGADPFRTLDELMAVVEALCPIWPSRGTFVGAGAMLL